MKWLLTLAALTAFATLALNTAAHAAPGKGKQHKFTAQTGNSQFQSSQTPPYQGVWNGQISGRTSLRPSLPAQPTGLSRVPKFGFESSFGWQNDCLGEHVTQVQLGGPASRWGLETGDAIVGVNGMELQTANCWYNAMDRAADQDGWVTLKIVDGRSGRIAYRTANLFQLKAR